MEKLIWHKRHWQLLARRWEQRSIAHAMLLCGPKGIGKFIFAQQVAQSILCETHAQLGHACGHCSNCDLLAAATHPDCYRVEPEANSKFIKVEQIRELCAQLSLKSQRGGYKVAIISLAEQMNNAAANSLLKTLEEPSSMTLLMLVSHQIGRLPATIVSRCQKHIFLAPPKEMALEWLKRQGTYQDPDLLLALAHGSPLAAKELGESDQLSQRLEQLEDFENLLLRRGNAVEIAARWLNQPMENILHRLLSWVMDMVRVKTCMQPPLIDNPDIIDRLKVLSKGYPQQELIGHWQRLQQAARWKDAQLNPQLFLEQLLISWTRV